MNKLKMITLNEAKNKVAKEDGYSSYDAIQTLELQIEYLSMAYELRMREVAEMSFTKGVMLGSVDTVNNEEYKLFDNWYKKHVGKF